ncbi:hypothetical protein [Sinorhizobium fredii]|uniref:HARP domain-containing protein n=1 Tax=Rhizobium fredii TaxID=380 RepID=A0A2L0HB84_RHIFR|nr:hypothetical protein [Sinorhizobium fredii]AUX78694.1 hypothetical protein NXT3_PB00032 [Sinorhizobium fredii]
MTDGRRKKDEPASAARVGATTDLPHDRITLARFREAFPRARWSDRLNADRFADEKGRDAFAFDPIQSRYLTAAPTGFQIRTPYSRTVVNQIREISHARWGADRRLWTVPYRSFDELRKRWLRIEAAVERSEPEARRARREAIKETDEDEASKARMRERRRKRYPIPADDAPPSERAIGTHVGVVFFIDTDGELADPATVTAFYFPAADGEEYVWASWRPGSLEELVTTWPARGQPEQRERERGWWMPDLEELRLARRDAKSRRLAKERKDKKDVSGERPADSA